MNTETRKHIHGALDSFYDTCYRTIMECESYPAMCKAMHEWNSTLMHEVANKGNKFEFFATISYLLCDAYFYTHSQCYDSPFYTFRKTFLEHVAKAVEKAKEV